METGMLLAVVTDTSRALLLWGAICLVPALVLAALAAYVTGRPYRQLMRTEFLLEVIEAALREGRGVEKRIIELAATRDLSLGVPFHMLAGYLQRGWTLEDALRRVPALAPPPFCAMLAAGREAGDVGRVLPHLRATLRDGISHSMASVNYQVVLAFVFNPIVLLLIPFLSMKIMPVFGEVMSGWGRPLPPVGGIFLHAAPYLFAALLGIALLLYLFGLVVLGGPRAVSWLEAGLPQVSHWIWLRVPWRRKRMLRDFAGMLGLLLDAGVPEARAVALAAASLDNRCFEARAQQVIRRLETGEKLAAALGELDASGELTWRLRNAAHGAGFLRSLAGWREALDAAAFRQEQAAAQGISTLLLLVNGTTVALVAATVFSCLSAVHVVV
jgi:type II secretory pathway component PulF